MANLAHRRDVVLTKTGTYLTPTSSVSVMALPVGAQVTSASSGTTATVRAGHGFQINDKFIVWRSGASVALSYNLVSAQSATSLTITAFTLAIGDILVNLGADTGSATPNWNGAPLRSTFPINIYSDMSGAGSAVTNATVSTNATGEYEYWYSHPCIWELIRTTNTVLDVNTDVLGGTEAFGTDTFHTIVTGGVQPLGFSGASQPGLFFNHPSTTSSAVGITWCRDKALRWSIGEDFYVGDRSYLAILSDKGIAGSSGDIFGVSWYGAETANTHGGTGGTASPKWFFNNTPFGNYASNWTFQFMGGSLAGRSAIFSHYANTGDNGGIDIYTSGGNNAIQLWNEDGSSYRSSIRFVRVTTAGGSTVNADWILGMGIVTGANTFSIYDQNAGFTRSMIDSSGNHIWTNFSGSQTPTFLFDFYAQTATTATSVNPFALRLKSTGTPAAGLSVYQQFRMGDSAGTEFRAAAVGARMTDATAGAPKGDLELWSSYATDAVVYVTSTQRVGVNISAPTQALDVVGSGKFTTGVILATGAAPTVAASQVGFGATVAATATNGTGEAMKANVEGYLIVNVAGTAVKVPYVKT